MRNDAVFCGIICAHCLGNTGPSKRSGQWGELGDETCPWVGSNQQPSDQKSNSTLPLDYCGRKCYIGADIGHQT